MPLNWNIVGLSLTIAASALGVVKALVPVLRELLNHHLTALFEAQTKSVCASVDSLYDEMHLQSIDIRELREDFRSHSAMDVKIQSEVLAHLKFLRGNE